MSEAGGSGVPEMDGLRERLKGPEGYETWNACVDDVFTEIAAAGLKIVPASQYSVLCRVAAAAQVWALTDDGDEEKPHWAEVLELRTQLLGDDYPLFHEPGDLERPEGI